MRGIGNDEEEAAITLGAGGWMTFFRITLPKVRWGLVYGVILRYARAMGAFAVASLLTLLAVFTLVVKELVAHRRRM